MGRHQNSGTLQCVHLSVCLSVCTKWDNIKIYGCPMLIKMRVHYETLLGWIIRLILNECCHKRPDTWLQSVKQFQNKLRGPRQGPPTQQRVTNRFQSHVVVDLATFLSSLGESFGLGSIHGFRVFSQKQGQKYDTMRRNKITKVRPKSKTRRDDHRGEL